MTHRGVNCQLTPLASILHDVLQFSRKRKKAPPEDAMNSPAQDLQSMLCIQHITPQSSINHIESRAIQALASSNSATFSPELASFLRYVEEHGYELSQNLASSIDQLQELFLGAVHQAFQLAGVTVDSRMFISLNRQGKLHIETACDAHEQITELLSSSKVLPALLKLISVQSAILDGIRNLRRVSEAQDSGDSDKLFQVQQAYRVCLKGQLSHFYSA
jgi:hypothetical protein